jgi:hypothetical protein
VKKILGSIKEKLYKYLCQKNIHIYTTLFFGYPAFSETWYKTSICPSCRKTKLTLQKNTELKPATMDFNRNYITYNKKLSVKDMELAREMVYKMNRKLKKLSTPPKDTVK